MTVWSLTTDTDNGLYTSLYLTEHDAYQALIRDWFGDASSYAVELKQATDALASGIPAFVAWFDEYMETEDGRAVVIRHDHPWTFGPDDDLPEPTEAKLRRKEAFAPEHADEEDQKTFPAAAGLIPHDPMDDEPDEFPTRLHAAATNALHVLEIAHSVESDAADQAEGEGLDVAAKSHREDAKLYGDAAQKLRDALAS